MRSFRSQTSTLGVFLRQKLFPECQRRAVAFAFVIFSESEPTANVD